MTSPWVPFGVASRLPSALIPGVTLLAVVLAAQTALERAHDSAGLGVDERGELVRPQDDREPAARDEPDAGDLAAVRDDGEATRPRTLAEVDHADRSVLVPRRQAPAVVAQRRPGLVRATGVDGPAQPARADEVPTRIAPSSPAV